MDDAMDEREAKEKTDTYGPDLLRFLTTHKNRPPSSVREARSDKTLNSSHRMLTANPSAPPARVKSFKPADMHKRFDYAEGSSRRA